MVPPPALIAELFHCLKHLFTLLCQVDRAQREKSEMINALQQLEASLANAEAELAHAADCLAQSEDQLAMRGESRVAMPALKPRMVTMGTQTDNSDSNVTVRVCACGCLPAHPPPSACLSIPRA